MYTDFHIAICRAQYVEVTSLYIHMCVYPCVCACCLSPAHSKNNVANDDRSFCTCSLG